jgi:hypothetical protein
MALGNLKVADSGAVSYRRPAGNHSVIPQAVLDAAPKTLERQAKLPVKTKSAALGMIVFLLLGLGFGSIFFPRTAIRTTTSTVILPASNASPGVVTEEIITEVFVTDDICVGEVGASTQTLYLSAGTEPPVQASSITGSTTTTLTFINLSTSYYYQNVTITTQGSKGVSITCTMINPHYNTTESINPSCPPCA